MYNALIVVILCFKTLLLLLRWDMGKVRDWFGGMGSQQCNYKCNHKLITDVIT